MKGLLKQRGMSAAVLATSPACAAASATLVLPAELHASVRMSALPVALDTAASLVALLAAFLVVGRFCQAHATQRTHAGLRASGARALGPDANRGGFGLISLRERARSAGGEPWITSIPGRGSEVEAVL